MTVGKAVALRRAGSLPGLVVLEVGVVVGLHRLGGLAAFRIPWQHFGRDLGPWLLHSPVEDVLGAVLRMVALLVAWWLLASTALYLAASLTRVPALIRSVEWLTLPLVRQVADRAVAVALATSIAGATPAVAGTLMVRRAPGTVAAAATTTTAPPSGDGYVPQPAGPPGRSAATSSTSSTTTTPATTTTRTPTTPASTTGRPRPGYTPRPAGTATTRAPTTTTQAPTATTRAPTTLAPTTTVAPTTRAPTTTRASTTSPAARPPTTPTVAPPGPKPTFPATTTTAAPGTTRGPVPTTRQGPAPTTTRGPGSASTTGAPGPGYTPRPAGTTTTTTPKGGGATPPTPAGPPGPPGPGPKTTVPATTYRVQPGDNFWLIARKHLAQATGRSPGSLRTGEVAAYWVRVVAANRARIRSKNPDLIFPGEYVRLPAVRASAGR